MKQKKQEKVFCKDCRWCYFDYEYECRNKETAAKKSDSYLEKGGEVVSYYYCCHLNKKNNCSFFEKKNWKYYLFFKFFYYRPGSFRIVGFLLLFSICYLIFGYILREDL